jgi:uncharacterized protein
MALLDQIQAASLAARQNRDAARAALLTTLFAEAARVGKDKADRLSSDDEVLETVRKFVKNAKETLSALGAPSEGEAAERVARRLGVEAELAMLQEFLPTQASEADVAAFIQDVVNGLAEKNPKQMGVVMGQLKARFGDNYDKSVASKLVKAALAG